MSKLSKIIDYLIKVNGDRYDPSTRVAYLIMMIVVAILSGQILKQLWQICG